MVVRTFVLQVVRLPSAFDAQDKKGSIVAHRHIAGALGQQSNVDQNVKPWKISKSVVLVTAKTRLTLVS